MTTTIGTQRAITGVDFVALPTRDLEAAVEFYGTTLGLPRSAYRPDQHHAEFETGNLTLNIMNPERMGLEHHPFQNALALQTMSRQPARTSRSVASGSTETRSTPASATWRSSATPTGTR